MAEDKKSFLMYADYINTFEELSDDEAGKLIKHVLRYVNDQDPSTDDRLIKIVFEPIKQQMKRDLISWREVKNTKSESGALGNLKRWNEDLYNKVVNKEIEISEAVAIAKDRYAIISDKKTSQNIANVAVTDNVTVNVNDSVIKKDKHHSFFNSHLLPFKSEEFNKCWIELLNCPKWKKKSSSAIEKTIEMMGSYNEAFVVKQINASISNDYQGLFFPNSGEEYQKFLRSIGGNNISSRTEMVM